MATRTCSAAKYTCGFLMFFVLLLALGLVLKRGKQSETSADWRDKLSNDFTSGEAILSFSIGCLACFGLIAYVVYAAYGIARIPLKLMGRAKVKISKPIGSAPTDGPRVGTCRPAQRSSSTRQ